MEGPSDHKKLLGAKETLTERFSIRFAVEGSGPVSPRKHHHKHPLLSSYRPFLSCSLLCPVKRTSRLYIHVRRHRKAICHFRYHYFKRQSPHAMNTLNSAQMGVTCLNKVALVWIRIRASATRLPCLRCNHKVLSQFDWCEQAGSPVEWFNFLFFSVFKPLISFKMMQLGEAERMPSSPYQFHWLPGYLMLMICTPCTLVFDSQHFSCLLSLCGTDQIAFLQKLAVLYIHE